MYSGSASDARSGSGHHVLLHPRRPRWLVLNRTGLEIARRLAGGASIEEAAADLVYGYGITAERASADVASVSDRLREEGFLGVVALRMSERSPTLKSLYLHLTSRCNLSCPHCYALSPEATKSAPKELPTGVVLALIDELAGLGGRAVTLSGGEALLHPGIRRILRHATDRGLDIRLLTNGTLLDRNWAGFLADLPVSVQVSLDGSRPQIHDAVRGHGSFHKALQAVGFLQKAGLAERINLCTTVMRGNIEDLLEIIRLAGRLGVPLVRFLPLRRKGMARASWESVGTGFGDYEQFYRQIAGLQTQGKIPIEVSCGLGGFLLVLPEEAAEDEIWCPVGRKIDVDFDGNAYPCVLLMEERFIIGNVHRDSLESMLRSDKMRQACRDLGGRRLTIKRCAPCLWRNLCQAGCMGQALDHAGTIRATDDFCRYRKKAYEEAFDKILALETQASP